MEASKTGPSYEENKKTLDSFECHFKWKPEGENFTCKFKNMVSKLIANISENPEIEVQALTLLCYIHSGSISRSDTYYKKAMEYADQALTKTQNNGDKFVILANKLHILRATKRRPEFQKLFQEIQTYKRLLDNFDWCRIRLIEAYALTRFGLKEYNRALGKFRDAKNLDPKSPHAHYGIGLILGRIRRFHHGEISLPCEEEIDSFKTSVELFDNDNPFAIVWYAFALISEVRSSNDKITGQQLLDKYESIHELFERSMTLAQSISKVSCVVYKWCAKGYKTLCLSEDIESPLPKPVYSKFTENLKICNDRACEANPNDSSSLHEAALFYWHVEEHQDLSKAKGLFERACKNASAGNFPADVDYVYFCKENEKDYRALDAFTEVLNKYENRNKTAPFYDIDLALLHMYIAKEMIEEGELDSAQDDLLKAIILDPEGKKTKEARKILLQQILIPKKEALLCKLKDSDNDQEDLIQFKDVMLDLGEVYDVLGESRLSAKCYEEILSYYQSCCETKTKLCNAYYKMKDYDKCIELCNTVRDCDSTKEVSKLLAKSYYFRGVKGQAEAKEVSCLKEDFLFSAKYGLVEGCQEVLVIIDQTLKADEWFHTTKTFYEYCAILLRPTEEYFSLKENNSLDIDAKQLMEKTQTENIHSDLTADVIQLRVKRLNMTIKINDDPIQVLSEARNQLDRSFKKFVDVSFPGMKPKKIYYPYLKAPAVQPGRTNLDLRKSQEEIEKRLESPKEGMGLKNFKERFQDVFNFLTKHQPVFDSKYNFVPEFCTQVNIHKHDRNMKGEVLYETAHSACEYVEEVMVELSKHLPDS